MISRTMMDCRKQASKKALRRPLRMEALEDRLTPTVVTFQEGFPLTVDGLDQSTIYFGTADTEITSETVNADVNFGEVTTVSIDQQDALGTRQALLRFDNIFGMELGQIPPNAKINSAVLTLRVASATNDESFCSFNRMLVPWDENGVTWNSFPSVAGGVQFDGIEAAEEPDGQLPNNVTASNIFANIDITPSLRAWAAGVPNFGWLNHQFGENGWDWRTSEFASNKTHRPKLTVDFTAPSGAGNFEFLDTRIKVPEGNTGTRDVTFTVLRTAGAVGEAKVDYALDVSPGTASNGVDYSFTAGQLTFPAGVTTKTFTVTVNGDFAIEGPETVRIRLSNPTGGAVVDPTLGLATLTIVDNEILLNEVMNVAAGKNDLGYEFVEILGSKGSIALGGITGINGTSDVYNIYLLAINGDAEEIPQNPVSTTAPIGVIDTVTNLSTATLGSGGLLVVRPTDFKYYSTPPLGTNDFIEPLLDSEPTGGSPGEGRWDNSSITFALVLSKTAPVAGTDLDNGSNGGVADDGIIDNLPPGAILLDSIGTLDNHRPSSDRVLGEFWAGIRQVQANGYIDAFSRFNSIGDNDLKAQRIFSWYAGDLKEDLTVYADPQATATLGRATPNIPAGARITPGELNIPRAISFKATQVQVNETAGNAIVTVVRTGDDSVSAKVNFTTVNGTAKAGSDFTAQSGILEFPIGVSSKNIVIPITNDTDPEGFEDFFVTISNPDPSQFVIATFDMRVVIADDDSKIRDFQQEVDGYTGTFDTTLFSNPTLAKDNFSSNTTIEVDQQDGTPAGPVQGLLRFNDMFGSGLNQVPEGSRIYGGVLTLNVVDGADAATRIRFFRMLQNWNPLVSSWFDPLGTGNPTPSVTGGITPDDVEASAVADFEINPASRFGTVSVNVPASVLQAWASGAPNFGWSIVSQSSNGWDFDSSEAFLASSRPKLSVIYTEPSGPGGFQFEHPTYIVNEGSVTAQFTIIRVGGSAGPVEVEYSLQGVTATAVDDFAVASGKFLFADGVTRQTFTVTLLEDNFSERNETFLLKLSNPTKGATIISDSATVTIRDNDLHASIRLNEVNINPPATDQPFEYAELIGASGVGLGNVYFIAMEGDNNVFAGNADLVADLSALNNGTTGFSVVTSDVGGHNIPAGTTQFKTFLLSSGSNDQFRFLQNDTNAFLVIYSPNATISSDVFDYDWDNDGILELPAGAFIVDAIGINDGGSGDINYVPAVLTLSGGVVPDAASRFVGNSTANDASAWFYGDIVNNLGNASRYYDKTKSSSGLPAGAVITPGAANFSVNTAPVITSNGGGSSATINIPTLTAAVTTVTFTDPDIGQPFSFSLSGPDASKFAINQTTGALTFLVAPDAASPGDVGADNVYNVTVTISDGTDNDTQDLAVRVVPAVTSSTVNGGDPQRSRILSVTVNFNGIVDAAFLATAGQITFTRTAGGPTTVVDTTNGLVVTPATGNVNSVTLTFANVFNAGVENASLADGRWQLAIPAANFSSTAGDPTLRRLYGDINADGTVDGTDFGLFGTAFGGANVPFDFDNNGNIDGNDFGQFGARFGLSL